MTCGPKTYLYRREDTGEVIEVPFAVMIDQKDGYITLEDGVLARRCLHLERDGQPEKTKVDATTDRPIVSDALGFTEHQFEEFEQDRVKNGFSGVEFIRDPRVPEFFQVKCASRAEHERYVKHRGYVNKTGIGGVRLTQEDLDRAKTLVERVFDGR
jgi:hypothetical protein